MSGKNKLNRPAPKLFSAWDIIAYSTLAIGVALLFLFLVILPAKDKAEGFKVYLDGNMVATYEYSTGTLKVSNGYEDLVSQNGNQITVYTDQTKQDFNVILVENKSVKVVDANCSLSKDCVYTPALTGNDGAIVCAPHKLKIVPLSSSNMTPAVSGGVR